MSNEDGVINDYNGLNFGLLPNGKRMVTNENITVDHFKVAVLLRGLIQKCPMDKWTKNVMLMRVGRPWEGLMPKTHLAIAIELKCTEQEVIEIEGAGKVIVEDFIKRCSDMAMDKKFEKDIANQAIKQDNISNIIF